MKESRFVKVGIILLIILLTVDIGSRILFKPLEAKAAEKIQYKCVNLEQVPSLQGVGLENVKPMEQFLNDMGSQGWELQFAWPAGAPFMIFKK